ncbi:hypothetical protein [Methylobacterium pseudosasicola]|uniref:Uncharacterized protein n=1 Tax=Methylobacterium pseudosasicola TaxID=582667 RepID=A0A1I4UVI1_9HYPH|nr:hypothetical protein [Methylobacterium pseudosasicola]SFM92753.1 hypothetical protein SAMN05192568_107813 [Methylobacterium pseudosasicola]
MSLRSSLKNLIRRDAERLSLRERAAELRASIPASKPQAAPEPTPDFAAQVAQAGPDHDVLAGGGIDHRDGTVSYADATGKVSRRPMAHWIGFNALQMHSRVRSEIGRRRIIEANHLPGDAHEAWEARIRRELRSDAVHALAFRHDRAFEAAQALRTGAEPTTQALRERGDAELLALAPVWEAAVDLYQRLSDEESLIGETASKEGWPGPAPAGAGPEWRAWFQQKEDWRERTGVASAEEASGEAGTALHKIELQIAELPAASLAGLKLKARVAQRSDDIDVTWPEGLGAGLARDILAFTEAQAAPPKAMISVSLVDQIDFASASLEDLQALHDIANTVADVASAMAWTGRCHARRWSEQSAPGDHYNAAGKLMNWLGDALTDVESAANKEAKRRRPTTSCDREKRLEILAAPVIQNGDPDETAAFARELATHAEAERAGR